MDMSRASASAQAEAEFLDPPGGRGTRDTRREPTGAGGRYVDEGACYARDCARRTGPSSFQVILGELTPGGQPCALHLLGMVSGVGAPPSAGRRNQSEIYRIFLRRDMVRDTLGMALCLRRAAATSRTAGGTLAARRQGYTQAARRQG